MVVRPRDTGSSNSSSSHWQRHFHPPFNRKFHRPTKTNRPSWSWNHPSNRNDRQHHNNHSSSSRDGKLFPLPPPLVLAVPIAIVLMDLDFSHSGTRFRIPKSCPCHRKTRCNPCRPPKSHPTLRAVADTNRRRRPLCSRSGTTPAATIRGAPRNGWARVVIRTAAALITTIMGSCPLGSASHQSALVAASASTRTWRKTRKTTPPRYPIALPNMIRIPSLPVNRRWCVRPNNGSRHHHDAPVCESLQPERVQCPSA